MIRPWSSSPCLARSRKYLAAKCEVDQVPRTWTAMTASQSSTGMFQIAESRTMPALLTRMSSWP